MTHQKVCREYPRRASPADNTVAASHDSRDSRIEAIQYEIIGLQGEIRAKYQQTVALQRRYVDQGRDRGENNITERKHTTFINDKYHDLPYYVIRIQRR